MRERHQALARSAPLGALACVLLLGGANAAGAGARPLIGRLRTSTSRCRSYGPVSAEVTLDWRGAKLLEGRLEVTVSQGSRALGRSISADMALTGGPQCYRMMLPAPRGLAYASEVSARLRFHAKDTVFDLESYPLFVPSRRQRALTVCVSEPRMSPRRGTLEMVSSLRLEEFDPRRRTRRRTSSVLDRPLSTLPAYMMPEDMPAHPLAYCAYDMVLLAGDGLKLVRERQLKAIMRWVEAGGSACVVPAFGGEGLKPYHVRFLNDLAGLRSAEGDPTAGETEGPIFRTDPGGELVARYMPEPELAEAEEVEQGADGGASGDAVGDAIEDVKPEVGAGDSPPRGGSRPGGLQDKDEGKDRDENRDLPPAVREALLPGIGFAFRVGVGRAVVVLRLPRRKGEEGEREDFEHPTWRRAVAFLWKVRASESSSIIEWLAAKAEERMLLDDVRRQMRRRPVAPPGEGPRGFGHTPIPTGGKLFETLMPETIRIIPFWLVVVILLLFVAVIGPVDYFVLGLLRKRKLTWLVFPAAAIGFAVFTMLLSEWYMGRTDRRRAVEFVDLGAKGKVLRRSRYELLFVARNKDVVTEVENALFAPVGRRTFSQGPMQPQPGGAYMTPDEGGVPLYEGRFPAHFRVTQELRQWEPQLNRAFSMEPAAKLASKAGINPDWDSIDRSTWNAPDPRRRVLEALAPPRRRGARGGSFDGYVCVLEGNGRRDIAGSPPGISVDFLREASVRPQTGLFSIVSQVSPTGGSNFEDLALLDPTDSKQWLLVAVVRRGDQILVFRRLYHDLPASPRPADARGETQMVRVAQGPASSLPPGRQAGTRPVEGD